MVSFTAKAQFNINDYKYVVVPKRFSDFKKENQHRSSTLVKHLFSQKGFETVYDDNLPNELNTNKCLGLFVGLIDDSSMFTTKTKLTLKDCNGKEVLVSQQGKSKNKEFEAAFSEAVTEAFESFGIPNYSYQPKVEEKTEESITVSFKNDVKTVENKPEESMQKDVLVTQEATKENQSYKDRTPIPSNYKIVAETEKELVEQKATIEEQSYTNKEPIVTDYQKEESEIENEVASKSITGVLYAQELPNGYQLVDSTPKIQLKIYKSSMPNVYLAKADDKDGVVYTSDGKWFFEYYSTGNMIVEELNIKF